MATDNLTFATADAAPLLYRQDSGGHAVVVSSTSITGPPGIGWYPAVVTAYTPGTPRPPITPPPPAPTGVQRPCDIYGAAGTPCVAAHSVTRSLYGGFAGALYAVTRASDSSAMDITVVAQGGVAHSAAQDAFCNGTDCIISTIYDQTGRGNHLATAPAGGNHRSPDAGVNATRLPTLVGGHRVYAAYFERGDGYRNDCTSGVATGDDPETIYMVTNSKHFDGGCCFDYGNAETNNNDDGAGTMECVYFGTWNATRSGWCGGAGTGPWVMADLENGLWASV